MYLSNDIPNELAGDVTQRPKDIKIQSPHVVMLFYGSNTF